MTDPLPTPHDRFFKSLMTRQEAVHDFLYHYLPSEVVAIFDLTTLQISKDSFIDPDLQEHFSDILYTVPLIGGQESYIYVLFEHKSYPDPDIAFQLLRYLVRIWEQDRKQGQPFRPVLPVVLYHGRREWRVALDFSSLFTVPGELRPYLPDFRYWLCDLSQYSDQEIKGVITLRVGLLLLKYILQDDFGDHLEAILGLMHDLVRQETGLSYLETALRYIIGSTDKVTTDDLKRAVETLFAEGEQLMATIAEQWVEQGREEGLLEGQREDVLYMLQIRFSLSPETEVEIAASLAEIMNSELLQRLLAATVQVESLADFKALLNEVSPPQDRP